jgi:RNA polymerase sigma-70 factor (ECF subfamily)
MTDRIEAPDRTAFEAEALPHLDAVYRFALRLSGTPDAAEDLVQETFLRAWRGWAQYTPGTRARSWLFTICRNVFLRRHEREQRQRQVVEIEAPRSDTGGAWGDVANPLWSAPGTDPAGAFFDSLVDESVLQAVDALPEEYRTAVLLSDLEGLPYVEIADIMEVPVGTVKSRIFRGRKQLQDRLYDYAVEMGYIAPETPEGDER